MILDGKGDGYYNMAKDEAIFNLYRAKKVPTLRVYGWSKPFVSLGYFQKVNEVLNHQACREQGISFVRRITGGAAILHQEELTYSLVLSSKDLELKGGVKESYRILTSFIINFYKDLGLNASYAGEVNKNIVEDTNFCYASFEYFDILIEGKKVGGNAQKRRKDLIFQQGSIPLKINFSLVRKIFKDNLKDLEKRTQGLEYFLRDKSGFTRLRSQLIFSFKKTLGVEFDCKDLDRDEAELCQILLRKKYLLNQWNWKDEETLLVKQKG